MTNSESLDRTTLCIRDAQAGDNVLQFFQLKAKETRRTRSGQDYLDLVLSDATGTISGKMWSDVLRKWGQDFNPGDFVKIEGRVESYRDRYQVIVEKIRRGDPSEIPDLTAVIRSTPHDTEALFAELTEVARSLEPPEMSVLVCHILEQHAEQFKTFPAAKMVHHAYKGGLIEHVATVVRKVVTILPLEPQVNRNIAIAGAILHDIGKLQELAPGGEVRTLEGRLLGHVVLGVSLIREAAQQLGMLDPLWLPEIEHIVVSHHGETQFGAPVKPATREAILVHFMDNLDSKLKIIEDALEFADSEGFTPYNKWLEGRAFAGSVVPYEEDTNVGD